MKRLWLVIVMLESLIPSAYADDSVVQACCRIKVDGDRQVAYGTGVLVGVTKESGFVLTNEHVTHDRTKQTVLCAFPDGDQYEGTVVADDATWDLACIRIARPKAISAVRFAADVPTKGQPVWHGGYGPQAKWAWVKGRVEGFGSPSAQVRLNDLMFAEGTSRDGDSGGPIMSETGELLGILNGRTDDGSTIGIQIGRVCQFCQCFDVQCGGDICFGRCCPNNPPPQQGNVVYAPQVRQPNSRPATPPSNGPSFDDGKKTGGCNCDAQLSAVLNLDARLKAIESRQALTGPPGPSGPPGPKGQDASDKPITFRLLAPDGTVQQEAQVRAGQTLTLQLFPDAGN